MQDRLWMAACWVVQFRRVIVPVQSSRILDRTLIYTAVTRATEQVVLVGDPDVLRRAVEALPSASRRQTGFISWIGKFPQLT